MTQEIRIPKISGPKIKKTKGKRSAKEAFPGGALGLLVGIILAYVARKYDIILPEGSTEVVVGALGAIGSMASSYIMGNLRHNRNRDQPHHGPGASDSMEEACK